MANQTRVVAVRRARMRVGPSVVTVENQTTQKLIAGERVEARKDRDHGSKRRS